ncbi:MAG: peptidylprolyl isomerase [Chloroflexota bacterium]
MKRITFTLLLIGLMALAACGGAGTAPTLSEPEISGTVTSGDVADTADTSGATSAPAATEVTDATGSTDDAVEPVSDSDPTVVRDTDWSVGPEDAVVTVIEYADFQCPGCAAFTPVLRQLSNEFPDDVRLVYRYFPLNSIHPLAQMSAEAAEAAGAQGKFWEYNEALFAQQSDWSSLNEEQALDFFVNLASTFGLDTDKFTEELTSGVYTEKISQSEQEAIALGLPGTPSVLVNGEIVPGDGLPRDLAIWEEYVNSEKALKELAERQYSSAPPMTIDTDAQYLAHVQMENGGTFTIELLPKSAPQTVNSFVFLARDGWFDGVTFHRVLPGFVAQTGDPSGTGRGGPGYMLPNEIDPELSHDSAGVVAMANAGPNTNGSQWYITYGDVSQLDGSYTIFGRVTEGMDVVEAITPRDPSTTPNAPAGDKISTITIEEIN